MHHVPWDTSQMLPWQNPLLFPLPHHHLSGLSWLSAVADSIIHAPKLTLHSRL